MPEIIKALTWTFIHSLWQGLLVALVAAAVISSTRRSSPRLRYNMLGLLLLIFVIGFVITFIIQLNTATSSGTVHAFTIAGKQEVATISNPFLANFIAWVNINALPLFLLWTFFFLYYSLRLVIGLAAVNRLRHYKVQPVPAEWKIKFGQLQMLIGIRRPVSLLQSGLVKVPVALGIVKPIILIPIGLLTHLPAEQIETILLHELAHIRRRDYLINLLQHIAETFFFFNPAIRWMSSLLRQEREACCDDIVVTSGSQKSSYLNALVNFQEYSINQLSCAMSISTNKYHLLTRIKRLLTNRNKGINLFEKISLLAGIIFFSAFSFVATEKKVKTIPATVQQQPTLALPGVATRPGLHPIKTKKKDNTRFAGRANDTLPRRKDTAAAVINSHKSVTKDEKGNKAAADAKLQEIIQIKNQIGVKKENIGIRKEQLKVADEGNKKKINKQIEHDRIQLEDQREKLARKRKEWEDLKKQELKKIVNDKVEAAKSGNTVNNNNSAEISVSGSTSNSIDDNKTDEHEFNYKMNLRVKDPPASIKKPEPPGNLKNKEGPGNKIRKDRTYI